MTDSDNDLKVEIEAKNAVKISVYVNADKVLEQTTEQGKMQCTIPKEALTEEYATKNVIAVSAINSDGTVTATNYATILVKKVSGGDAGEVKPGDKDPGKVDPGDKDTGKENPGKVDTGGVNDTKNKSSYTTIKKAVKTSTSTPAKKKYILLKYAKIKKIKAQKYTGKKIKPKVVITLRGKKLKKNKDYKLTYSKNIKVGKARIKITGKGNYRGTRRITFKIKKRRKKL